MKDIPQSEYFHWFHLFDTAPEEALRRLARLQSNPGPEHYASPEFHGESGEPYERDIYWLQMYFMLNPSVYRELYVNGTIGQHITERSANTMLLLTNNADLLNYEHGIHHSHPRRLYNEWITPYTCYYVLNKLAALQGSALAAEGNRELLGLVQSAIIAFKYSELYATLVKTSFHMKHLESTVAQAFTERNSEVRAVLEHHVNVAGEGKMRTEIEALVEKYTQEKRMFLSVVPQFECKKNHLFRVHGGYLMEDSHCGPIFDKLKTASENEQPSTSYNCALLEFVQIVVSGAGGSLVEFETMLIEISYRMQSLDSLFREELLQPETLAVLHESVLKNVPFYNKVPHVNWGYMLYDRICALDMEDALDLLGSRQEDFGELSSDGTKQSLKLWQTVLDTENKVDLLFSGYNVSEICNINFRISGVRPWCDGSKYEPREPFCRYINKIVWLITKESSVGIYRFIQKSAKAVARSPKLCALLRWYMMTHDKQAEYLRRGTSGNSELLPHLELIYSQEELNFIWLVTNNPSCINFDYGIELFDTKRFVYTTILPSTIAEFVSRVVEQQMVGRYSHVLRYLMLLAVKRNEEEQYLEYLNSKKIDCAFLRLSELRANESKSLYDPRIARLPCPYQLDKTNSYLSTGKRNLFRTVQFEFFASGSAKVATFYY